MPPDDNIENPQAARRRELALMLALADDESLLKSVWAVRAIQSGRAAVGLPSMRNVPEAAVTESIADQFAIYPWELETLANELLATPKLGPYRCFPASDWSEFSGLVNVLRNAENADGIARRIQMPILREMYRIQGRQFEWQTRLFSIPQFYRNAFIYGQGECAEFFAATYGITIPQFMLVGFALMSVHLTQPIYDTRQDLDWIGINPETLSNALSRLSAPIAEVRHLANRDRRPEMDTAYRPSILRNYPCVRLGPRHHRIIAPLPELIAVRATSGIFYDVIGGGGPVRADYGRRFERYVSEFITAMLPDLVQIPEWRYGPAGQANDTPDLMLRADDCEDISIAVECKSTKMSFGARFDEQAEQNASYADMVKAICQIWRFFSHCRRGRTGRTVTNDAVGIVLTLENWFVIGGPLLEEVEAKALARSRAEDAEILGEDRRKIIFCPMPDLEQVLQTATIASFRAAVAIAASEERRGWLLSSIHREVRDLDRPIASYPFSDQLGNLLPWWNELEAVFD